MEYNLKEQLIDKIGGLKLLVADRYGAEYNKGVGASITRVDNFFNDELIPEVPQYVADWYEKSKCVLDYAIWDVIQSNAKGNVLSERLNDWIENTEDAIIILVKMHLFGYKVEKVDLYRVKLINGGQYLHTETLGNTYFTCVAKSVYSKEKLSDLGFEWVLDCPGIVLEEV